MNKKKILKCLLISTISFTIGLISMANAMVEVSV